MADLGRYGKPLHFTETTFISGELGWDRQTYRRKTDPKWEWATTPEGDGRVRYMEAAPSSGETPDAEQQESPTIRDVGQR